MNLGILSQPQFYLSWMMAIGFALAWFGGHKFLLARWRKMYFDQNRKKWRHLPWWRWRHHRNDKIQTLKVFLETIIAAEQDNKKIFLGLPYFFWKWKFGAFFCGLLALVIGALVWMLLLPAPPPQF